MWELFRRDLIDLVDLKTTRTTVEKKIQEWNWEKKIKLKGKWKNKRGWTEKREPHFIKLGYRKEKSNKLK
jgi:hypothetical protein